MSKQNQHKPNVPELRFPEFSGEWKEKKLGEIANIVRGASPRPISDSKWFDENSTIGWLRISDVTAQNGRIRFLEQRLSELGTQKTRVLYTPHLLLSIAATVGKPVINYVETGVHDGFLIFQKPNFYIEYMYHWLEMFSEKWRKYGQPGSQVNLNSDIVKNQKIFIPTDKEQKKIGDFFSKLDRQIELEEKKLALLEEQKKGYMQKIFSQELRFKDENGNEYPKWKEANLEAVLKMKEGLRRGPFGGALKKEIFIEEGYAVYEQANAIYDNQTFRYFIDENKFNEMKNFSVKADDIIMSCSGTIGKLSLIPKNYKEGIINQALIRFRVSEKLNSLYFLYYMKSGMMQRKILKSNPGSAIVNLIPVKDLKKINLKVPSIEEQEKISNFLHNLDSLLAKKIFKIKMMKNRKDSFLQKMFL
ncbi:restriction endonuclease subunit S [Staphylococcus simulans]|uniref:restriction endonuclease subunit S n=1 Tax=Staphylococcus simulans TaxID=1286 RepID=UPI0021D34706|nr:restriction endonuclease subunit S [Staphylococcus simulans]UXR45316.1 restriction endonuclease subunit S [Staphylococcus simulans]